MENNFFDSLDRFELIAFFSGYPLVFAIFLVIASNLPSKMEIRKHIPSLLPFGYALAGTLYLGLQLRNLYPDYSIENIKLNFQQPFLKTWGLLAILFWIPHFAHKRVLSLIHSFVFFFLWARNLFNQLFLETTTDINIIQNNMKIYTDSLILNLGTFIVITLLFSLITYFNKRH